jgi:hypothetical protein
MKFFSAIGGLIIILSLGACQTVADSSINRGSFGPFMRSLNTTSHGYAVIKDPTGSAPAPLVERFEVRPGDCGSNDGWSDCAKDRERSELSERHKTPTTGTSSWYGWSLFVPVDYVNIYPTKVALGQFHQHRSHPVWMFQNSRGGYHLDDQVTGTTRRYYKLIDDKDLRGKWHRIEVHAKWANKNDGFFKVWVNGQQMVDYSGQTMSASATYFKYGLYRSFMSRYRNTKGRDDVPGQIVYYANVRRANSREGLAAPAQ